MIGIRVVIYFACLVMLLWGVLGFPIRGKGWAAGVGIGVAVLALCGRWFMKMPFVFLTPTYMFWPGNYILISILWILCFILIKGMRLEQGIFFLLLSNRTVDFLVTVVLQDWQSSSFLWVMKSSLTFLALLCLAAVLLRKHRQATQEAVQSIRRLPYWILNAVLLVFYIQFTFSYGTELEAFDIWDLIMKAQEENAIRCAEVNFAIALLCVAVLVFIRQRQVLREKDRLNRKCIQRQTNQYRALYESQQALRSFHHDMKAHIRSLQSLTKQNDMAGISRYLEDMGQTGAFSGRILQVNHIIGDAILNEYQQRGKKDDIKVLAMGHFPDPLWISEFDLCVILSNLMENAYTAALDTPAGQERFVLMAVGNSDELLQVSVSNSLDSSKLRVVDEKLCTTKEEKKQHGIGLKNVEQVVQKYGGSLRWSLNDEKTKIRIVINFQKNRENDHLEQKPKKLQRWRWI